jgi:hypothetical protein
MRSPAVVRWSSAALLLSLFSGAADAEWTPVGQANEIYAAFADAATIRRQGSSVTMQGLYDFRRQDFTPEGRGLYSTAVLREYDCEGRRVRLLSAIDFSGRMGAGTPVSTSSRQGRWEAVVAGGIDEAYWTLACGTK